ncbi:MAG: GNAT family protein [Bacteroidales bacterium]|nr:GNAT family protein [Bacteroidales bacterium]
MQAEIGYTLDKNFRGKGYAAEALTKIIDYLMNDLNKHRIVALGPTNSDSIRLVERLGFRKEAHFIKSLFFHGEWVDDLIYAILANEWKNSNYGIGVRQESRPQSPIFHTLSCYMAI